VNVHKHNTKQQIPARIEKNMVNVANKWFSWALLCQVATCRYHACDYRKRSFYRIFNTL